MILLLYTDGKDFFPCSLFQINILVKRSPQTHKLSYDVLGRLLVLRFGLLLVFSMSATVRARATHPQATRHTRMAPLFDLIWDVALKGGRCMVIFDVMLKQNAHCLLMLVSSLSGSVSLHRAALGCFQRFYFFFLRSSL